MSKKMFDILPPKMAHKVENFLGEKPSSRSVSRTRKSKHKEKRFPSAEIIIGGVVIISLLLVFAYIKLPKVEILIWPKTETLAFYEKVTADKSVNQIDQAGKIIPAFSVDEQKTDSQEFPSTGSSSDGGKATGTITIYNKYNPSTPLTLKAGTHFLSDSKKYFIVKEKVVVPGVKSGKPGSISVAAEAEDFGDSYNIAAAKFSVPKLAGTSFYYSIWAESDKAMTGGFLGKTRKVTDDDIKIAKNALTKKLLDDTEKSLRDKVSAENILLDNALSKTVVSATSNVKAGAVADKFTITASVKVSATTFKKGDLKIFTMSEINSKLDNSAQFLDESLDIKYNPNLVDSGSQKLVFDLQVSGKTYQNVDTKDLAQLLRGKSDSQVKDYINNKFNGQVNDIKVNFWPFWVKKVPGDYSRVKLNLSFN